MRGRLVSTGIFASVGGAAFAAAALALPPADVRLVAGAMPGYPLALPQVYPTHKLTAARRRLLAARFAHIRVGGDADAAISAMGHIHKMIGYGPAKGCDYFDGNFVLCVIGSRVVAKGFQTSG